MKRIWRLSHLWLAILSFGFLLIAGFTGVILATEPIINRYQQEIPGVDLSKYEVTDVISTLKDNYDEVFELKVNEHNQVTVEILNFEPELDGIYYFNPKDGNLIAKANKERNPVFEWSQTLHRSLFLETTGRNIMMMMAIFLSLIIVSGIALIIQRQQSWKKFYSKIVSSHFSQFSHVWLGRIFLFPLLIITISAIGISVERLGWFASDQPNETTYEYVETLPQEIQDFEVLQGKKLSDISKVEFPFSTEDEDYYRIYFKDEIVQIAQNSGQILSQEKIDTIQQLKPWFMLLHTGEGNWYWAIVLLFSALAVIYFIISGGIIFWKRNFKKKFKNTYKPENATYVILYGSENGSTKDKAYVFYQALIAQNEKAFITDLNGIKHFPNLQQLVIITSTYGNGEAPLNANQFLHKTDKFLANKSFKYSVVGFGSKEYPQYCQFAKDCQLALSNTKATMLVNPVYINHQNKRDFKNWWNQWAQKNQLSIDFDAHFKVKKPILYNFEILKKTTVDDGYQNTFNVWLKPKTNLNFESGDLLAVFAPSAAEERYYSLSKIDDQLFISVKLHEYGKCSQYLFDLKVGDNLSGYIKEQADFHYNPAATSHTYIANGTGVGPFIGMIQNNPAKKQHLILGLRNKKSYSLYQELLDGLNDTKIEISYSREIKKKRYLQEVVEAQKHTIITNLKTGGEVLICGNISIAQDVLAILNHALDKENLSIKSYQNTHQIKMDCY
ncbi:MAG: PepSY domain-containing protein [Weeksellaceae bacterium]